MKYSFVILMIWLIPLSITSSIIERPPVTECEKKYGTDAFDLNHPLHKCLTVCNVQEYGVVNEKGEISAPIVKYLVQTELEEEPILDIIHNCEEQNYDEDFCIRVYNTLNCVFDIFNDVKIRDES